MDEPVRQQVIFYIGRVGVTQVIVTTWGVMALLFIAAALIRMRLRLKNSGRVQEVVESMLSWLSDEIRSIIRRDPEPFLPLVASLFIFILFCNLTSLISSMVPGYSQPTADISTTGALATVVFLAVPFYGIVITGTASYLKTYIQPIWIMLPFNLISDLSRTLALAVRLFGNILSGEILFGVLLSLVPFILPLPLMFLSLITGTIQAYIFTVLAIVYIGGAVKVVQTHEKQEA